MRDDFNSSTAKLVADRVGHRCSNPACPKLTTGPHSEPSKRLNIGVAAHITAASRLGPRYDESLSQSERQSVNNAIWLCQNCAKLIDNDEARYNTDVLRKWKRSAEEAALREIEGDIQALSGQLNNEQSNAYADVSTKSIWLWDRKRKQYYNTQTRQIFDARKIIDLRETFIENVKAQTDALVSDLINNRLNVQDWTLELWESIKKTYICAFILAAGGRNSITDADRERMGVTLNEMLLSFQEFSNDVENGRYIGDGSDWIELQIQLRSRTYIDAVRQLIDWP